MIKGIKFVTMHRFWSEMVWLDRYPFGYLILSHSTQRVPGRKFNHAHGPRQGDLLPPMLFIIAIDPLHILIDLAARRDLLHPILPWGATMRCSLYADDASIFANPERMELFRLNQILNLFGNCSWLRVNLNKTEIFPIRCDEETLSEALSDFPGKIGNFPGKYLDLPLHTRKLRWVDVYPLIDKLGGRLPC
jgi:hypothetical protein